ncbi:MULTISPECIES: hypothetical protein [unclassified Aeromonas]|uniref:hypothetical protein n=1 Tax=unclassified Aeromonas TaxID=257493 RepID=UPI0035279AEF
MSMTSLDFLNNIINPARVGADESTVKNTHFLARTMDELDLDESRVKLLPSHTGSMARYVDLTEDQMRLVGMRESKAVRRAVLAELNRLYAKAKEAPKSVEELLELAAATIREKNQQIRDRALRNVMVGPKKLVAENNLTLTEKSHRLPACQE